MTVRVLLVKDLEEDVVWGEVKAKVKAEWVDRSPQGQAEIVCAPTAAQQFLMPQGSPAIRKRAPSAVRE